MPDPDDHTPPTWEDHAKEVGRQVLALDAMLAISDPDPDVLEAFIDQVEKLRAGPEGDDALDGLLAALARYGLEFARAAHPHDFRAVLAQRRTELRAHLSDYEPPGEPR